MSTSAVRFQPGGALLGDRLYVSRRADDQLLAALREGEPCFVFAPRQVGKTSLCLRAMEHLRSEGWRCGYVDLQALGDNGNDRQWYLSLVDAIARELDLDLDIEAWERAHASITALQMFRTFLHTSLPSEVPIALFFDEVEVLLDAKNDVRLFLNITRTLEMTRRGLVVCAAGSATVGDFVSLDTGSSFFTRAQAIALEDFDRHELARFSEGLLQLGAPPDELLDAVYEWTSGHPGMTQEICWKLAREGERPESPQARVRAIVARDFLPHPRIEHPLLRDAERRFERACALFPVRGACEVWLGLIAPDSAGTRWSRDYDRVISALRVAGMVTSSDGGALRVRNRIYHEAFDIGWLRTWDVPIRANTGRYRAPLPERWPVAYSSALPVASALGLAGGVVSSVIVFLAYGNTTVSATILASTVGVILVMFAVIRLAR